MSADAIPAFDAAADPRDARRDAKRERDRRYREAKKARAAKTQETQETKPEVAEVPAVKKPKAKAKSKAPKAKPAMKAKPAKAKKTFVRDAKGRRLNSKGKPWKLPAAPSIVVAPEKRVPVSALTGEKLKSWPRRPGEKNRAEVCTYESRVTPRELVKRDGTTRWRYNCAFRRMDGSVVGCEKNYFEPVDGKRHGNLCPKCREDSKNAPVIKAAPKAK